MRHAVKIFGYGLTQLFVNFGTALRLTGLVWVLASLAIYGLGLALVGQPVGVTGVRPDAEGQMPGLSATFALSALAINLVAVAMVILLWSRFCLGKDTPGGLIPVPRGLPLGGVLLTLVLVVASVGALGFALTFLTSMAVPVVPLTVGLFVFPPLTMLVLVWLLLRLGAAIPASAMGRMMSLTDAWAASRGRGIWLLAVLAVMVGMLLFLPAAMLSGLLVVGNIASVLSSWLITLIGTGWLVAILRMAPEPAP